jgi:hypothetical protein
MELASLQVRTNKIGLLTHARSRSFDSFAVSDHLEALDDQQLVKPHGRWRPYTSTQNR